MENSLHGELCTLVSTQDLSTIWQIVMVHVRHVLNNVLLLQDGLGPCLTLTSLLIRVQPTPHNYHHHHCLGPHPLQHTSRRGVTAEREEKGRRKRMKERGREEGSPSQVSPTRLLNSFWRTDRTPHGPRLCQVTR